MYIIKMMNNDNFEISPETFYKLSGQSGLVEITELNAIINLNSVSSIIPKGLEESKLRTLKDGLKVVKKFNDWYLANDQSVKVNIALYPELLESNNYKQLE